MDIPLTPVTCQTTDCLALCSVLSSVLSFQCAVLNVKFAALSVHESVCNAEC